MRQAPHRVPPPDGLGGPLRGRIIRGFMETPLTPGSHRDARETLPLIQGLSQLHDAVALLDDCGQIAWMSDGLAALCGEQRAFEQRHWSALLADASAAAPLERRLEGDGRLLNERVRLRGASGEVPARMSAARLNGATCAGGATVAILRLDADSERVDREFRHTVEYLGAILDSSPDGVIVVDRSRFITYANPAMAGLTGFGRGDLVDRPLALFVRSQDDLEQIALALRPENPVQNRDLELRRRDGSHLLVSVSASLLRLPDGTEVGAVAYVRDVSEQRRAEAELARKNAELEHYVDAVSHDLRSPLVSLLGFSRLLREDYAEALDDKGRHFVKRIEEAGRTMEQLIHDLLELSRLGRSSRADAWADPKEVLQQLHAELKPRLDSRGAKLDVEGELPLLRCDRTRLYQVFSNLIGNALDHMGEDVPEPTVRVEITNGGAFHRISVRDNGRGIDPAHHDRIFEVFQSLSPRADGRRGTGIGLSIVKKIAETQGGDAWVESPPDGGACFHVSLPCD